MLENAWGWPESWYSSSEEEEGWFSVITKTALQDSSISRVCFKTGCHLELYELYWDTVRKTFLGNPLLNFEFSGISILLNIIKARVIFCVFDLRYLNAFSNIRVPSVFFSLLTYFFPGIYYKKRKNKKKYDEASAGHNQNAFLILSPQTTHLTKCMRRTVNILVCSHCYLIDNMLQFTQLD